MRSLLLAGVMLVGAQGQAGWEAERAKALQLGLDNKTADAVKVLEAAVTRYPAQADAHYELADALLEQVYADSVAATPPANRAPRLERVATHFRRAMALDAQYRQVASVKLVKLYEEEDFQRPREVERLARDLMTMDPASGVWAIKLAHSLAAQARCGEGARVLVAARARIERDRRLLLGMAMPDLLLKCDGLPLADARPLPEAAESIAADVLKTTPDDRDAVMLQGAALTALASRLPEGPDRKAAEARSSALMDRFMDMNPARQRALQGEAPERVYDGFSYLNELLEAGKTQEAQRLYVSMKQRHAGSVEFWQSAATHHRMLGEHDEALAAARRHAELASGSPNAHLLMASLYMDRAAKDGAAAPQQAADLREAERAVDAALKAGPDDAGAMTIKASLLQAQADRESDPARKQALLAEWKTWATRASAAYRAGRQP